MLALVNVRPLHGIGQNPGKGLDLSSKVPQDPHAWVLRPRRSLGASPTVASEAMPGNTKHKGLT